MQIEHDLDGFRSRERNAILWIFRLLSKDDIEDILHGVASWHIRYVLGNPRKRAGKNPQKKPGDDGIYDALEGISELCPSKSVGPFDDIASALSQLIDKKLTIRDNPMSERVRFYSFIIETLRWGLSNPEDRKAFSLGLSEFQRLCQERFGEAWITRAIPFLVLHGLIRRLENEGIWTRQDRAAFKQKKAISERIGRHCADLDDRRIIRSEGEMRVETSDVLKTTAKGRSCVSEKKIIRRNRRTAVKFYPGENLWTEPNRWKRLRNDVLSTPFDDTYSRGSVCLFGVSRLNSFTPRHAKLDEKNPFANAFEYGMGPEMVTELEKVARRLRVKWLDQNKVDVNKQLADADSAMDDAFKEYEMNYKAFIENMPKISSLGGDEMLTATLEEYDRYLEECLPDLSGSTLQARTDKIREDLVQRTPRFPLIVLDLNSLVFEKL